MRKWQHVVVDVLLPHVLRGLVAGIAAALAALGVLTDRDGLLRVEVPVREQSVSSSKPSQPSPLRPCPSWE